MHDIEQMDLNARPVETGALGTPWVADMADRVDTPATLVAQRRKVSCGKCKTCTCLGTKVPTFGLGD